MDKLTRDNFEEYINDKFGVYVHSEENGEFGIFLLPRATLLDNSYEELNTAYCNYIEMFINVLNIRKTLNSYIGLPISRELKDNIKIDIEKLIKRYDQRSEISLKELLIRYIKSALELREDISKTIIINNRNPAFRLIWSMILIYKEGRLSIDLEEEEANSNKYHTVDLNQKQLAEICYYAHDLIRFSSEEENKYFMTFVNIAGYGQNVERLKEILPETFKMLSMQLIEMVLGNIKTIKIKKSIKEKGEIKNE